jgi:O-antigen/teichoic acid export membrane protein
MKSITQSYIKKVLKNSTILLTGNIVENIFGLLSVAILTHSQGVVIFGYYVLFFTFIEIIDKIFNFQTWQAFIKFATDFQVKDEHHNVMMLLKYSFLVDFASLIVATIVALYLSGFAVEFFNIPSEHHTLLLLMSLTILFKAIEISTGVFRFFDRFKVQAKIAVYSSSIKFAMFGIIALVSPSFEMFVYATVLTQFVTMIMKYFYAKSVLNEHNITIVEILTEKVNIPLLKKLKIFSFIVYNNFDVAVRMISRQLDTVILGKLYGAEIVGIYKIAKEIASLIAKLTDPVYQAIYPELAKMLANGKKLEAKQMAMKISLYTGGAGVVFYGLFALLGEWAISLAFGSEFLDAYDVTLVYFIAILIAIVTLPLYPMQHAFGYAKKAFSNQIHATLVYFPVLFPMIFFFEMIGASIAYVFYYTYLSRLTLNSVKKGFQ